MSKVARRALVYVMYTLDRCMFFMSAVPPGRVLHASTAYRTTLEFSARRPFCRARSGASINLLHPARHVRTFCSLPLESGELARSCDLSKSETQVTVSRGAATMVRPVAAVTTKDESDTTRRPGHSLLGRDVSSQEVEGYTDSPRLNLEPDKVPWNINGTENILHLATCHIIRLEVWDNILGML